MNTPPKYVNGQKKAPRKEAKRHSEFDDITTEMLVALRNGDHNAYNSIYLSCFEPIQAFFRLLLQNDSDAEELCQELFIRLWESREKINPELNFRSYLYTIAKSSALNHIKHKNVVNKYIDYKINDFLEVEHSADAQLISKEVSLIIRIYVENMPPQRRSVFELSRQEGMSNEDIARRLNISQATVRSHLHYAIKELREVIGLFVFLFVSY